MEQKIYMNYIHPSSLLRQLSDLWKDNLLCDAVITVDNIIVEKAHKVVLFAVSPKVKADSTNSSQQPILDVSLPPGIKHQAVHAFLQYIYEGYLILTKELAQDLLKISRFLEVKCLSTCCSDFVKSLEKNENAIAIDESPAVVETDEFNHVRTSEVKGITNSKRSQDEGDQPLPRKKMQRQSNFTPYQRRSNPASSFSGDSQCMSSPIGGKTAPPIHDITHGQSVYSNQNFSSSSQHRNITMPPFSFTSESPGVSSSPGGRIAPHPFQDITPVRTAVSNQNTPLQSSPLPNPYPVPFLHDDKAELTMKMDSMGDNTPQIDNDIFSPQQGSSQQKSISRSGSENKVEGGTEEWHSQHHNSESTSDNNSVTVSTEILRTHIKEEKQSLSECRSQMPSTSSYSIENSSSASSHSYNMQQQQGVTPPTSVFGHSVPSTSNLKANTSCGSEVLDNSDDVLDEDDSHEEDFSLNSKDVMEYSDCLKWSAFQLLSRKKIRQKPSEAQRCGQTIIRLAAAKADIWQNAPPMKDITQTQQDTFFNTLFSFAPHLKPHWKECLNRLQSQLINRRKYLLDKQIGRNPRQKKKAATK